MSEYLWTAFISKDASNRLLVCCSPDGTTWPEAFFFGQTSKFSPSRLLKKSLAAAGEDGVVAVVEGQLDFDGAVVLQLG
jgi:hypothetical protein